MDGNLWPQLYRLLIGGQSFFVVFKCNKHIGQATISSRVARVKFNNACKRSKSFFIALEGDQRIAHIVITNNIIWIEFNTPFTYSQGLLIPFKVIEATPFSSISINVVRV